MYNIVIKYGRKNSGHLNFVYIFYLLLLISFLPSSLVIKYLSCNNFSPFMQVKLIDYQCVNRSDFKPGSSPVITYCMQSCCHYHSSCLLLLIFESSQSSVGFRQLLVFYHLTMLRGFSMLCIFAGVESSICLLATLSHRS